MQPVRVRISGLIPMTRRGYKILLVVVGVCMLALLVIRLWWMPELPHAHDEGVPQPNLLALLWDYTPLLLFVLAVLCAVEAIFVFRRFDQAEAEQARQSKPAPKTRT